VVAAVATGAEARPGAVRGASELPELEVDITILIGTGGIVVDTAIDSGKIRFSIEVVVAVAESAGGDGILLVLGAEVEVRTRAVETSTTTERDVGIALRARVHGELVAPGVGRGSALRVGYAKGNVIVLTVSAVAGGGLAKSHSSKKGSNEEDGPHVRKKKRSKNV